MLTEILTHLQFTSPTWVYALPLILMGVDILTGLVNACFKEKNFHAKFHIPKGFSGSQQSSA